MLNVLVWHVHGSWTTSFVHRRHRYLLPTPKGNVPSTRHPAADRADIPLVHVTWTADAPHVAHRRGAAAHRPSRRPSLHLRRPTARREPNASTSRQPSQAIDRPCVHHGQFIRQRQP
jgi:hypothetical protein